MKDIITLMVHTAKKSCDNLRAQISNVRYGPPGTIYFEFKGKPYSAPEPKDVMPVGCGECSQSWALKQILNNIAKER